MERALSWLSCYRRLQVRWDRDSTRWFATPWAVLLLLATKPEAVAAYRGTGGAVVLAIGTAMAVAGYRVMLAIGRLPSEERVLR